MSAVTRCRCLEEKGPLDDNDNDNNNNNNNNNQGKQQKRKRRIEAVRPSLNTKKCVQVKMSKKYNRRAK